MALVSAAAVVEATAPPLEEEEAFGVALAVVVPSVARVVEDIKYLCQWKEHRLHQLEMDRSPDRKADCFLCLIIE